MIVKTTSLDKAAFYLTFGGTMVSIEGHYPQNTFNVKVNRLVKAYEDAGGWVPYNAFCNQRRVVKRQSRRLAGLPEYFTGHQDTGVKLGDLPVVVPFKKKEIERWNEKHKA